MVRFQISSFDVDIHVYLRSGSNHGYDNDFFHVFERNPTYISWYCYYTLYLIRRVIVAVSNLQVASTAWCRQKYFDRGQGTAHRLDRAYRLWGSERHIVSLGKPGRLLWWKQWWWIRRWREREFSLDILTKIFFYHY